MFPRALIRAREQSARAEGPPGPSSAGSLWLGMNDEIEIADEDLRFDHWWYGAEKGSPLRVTHLPTGVSLFEEQPYDGKDALCAQRNRMMAELKDKIKKIKTRKA